MPCTETAPPACRRSARRITARALQGLTLVLLPTLWVAGCASRETAAPPPTVAGAAALARPVPRQVVLPTSPAARSWDEFQLTAARRLVAAQPDASYMGPAPAELLGIPVLDVELNADGSVRGIQVVREPRAAKETIQLAIDAVHRAAPYGDVSRLSRPWIWREVFLFDDERRFKPATLDR